MSNYIHFDIEANQTKPLFTVAISSVGEGRYLVQTRCPSDYGHVQLEVEPHCGEGHVTVEWAVGEDQIPSIYFAAVVEGIRIAASENREGAVVDVKVKVIGGSAHPIDSCDRSYRVAARYAFEDALQKAGLVEVSRTST